MHRVLLVMMMTAVFLYAMGFEADRYVTETVHNRLKFGLNRSAHDASLQVDKLRLAEGQVVFVRAEARLAFEAGLRSNLELRHNLAPLAGTLLQQPIDIVYEDYVDDATPGVQFPFSYVRPDQHIYRMVEGPSVIYRVRVPLPRTNRFSYDGYVYKTVVYEYPFY